MREVERKVLLTIGFKSAQRTWSIDMERKKHQGALTVQEQAENLKVLNLTIKDEAFAVDFLNDVSYFRFIKAYSLGLKPKNGSYYAGVTFEQLVELYLFNANFRQLLFSQIEKVEINLRCRVSNYFSSTYGVLCYKDSANFADADYHAAFLIDINNEVSRNRRASFIKNFQNNYEKVIFRSMLWLKYSVSAPYRSFSRT